MFQFQTRRDERRSPAPCCTCPLNGESMSNAAKMTCVAWELVLPSLYCKFDADVPEGLPDGSNVAKVRICCTPFQNFAVIIQPQQIPDGEAPSCSAKLLSTASDNLPTWNLCVEACLGARRPSHRALCSHLWLLPRGQPRRRQRQLCRRAAVSDCPPHCIRHRTRYSPAGGLRRAVRVLGEHASSRQSLCGGASVTP